MAADLKSVRIGEEHDGPLRRALEHALEELGAQVLSSMGGLAGSQDYLRVDFRLREQTVTLECETYFGLTISGPPGLVDAILDRVERSKGGH